MDISTAWHKSHIHTWIYPWDISMDIHIHGNPDFSATVWTGFNKSPDTSLDEASLWK